MTKASRLNLTLLILVIGVLHLGTAKAESYSSCPPLFYKAKALPIQPNSRSLLSVRYRDAVISELPEGSGFEVVNPHNSHAQHRVIKINATFHPLDIWERQIWTAEGQSFQFIDVGYSHLEADSEVTNAVLAAHLLQHPDEDLEVIYGQRRVMSESIIKRYRRRLHKAVMDLYLQTKRYLTQADIVRLEAINYFNDNSDVFGLLENMPKTSLVKLSPEEIAKHLIMTIQVSYFEQRNFTSPSLKGVLLANGEPVNEDFNKMPFEYRILPQALPAFRKKFYHDFDHAKICELTRYAKFVNKIPSPIQNRFLYEAFAAALKRGKTVIFASADRGTARLYRRYGFRKYADLPTGSGEPEFLYYLQFGSPDFQKLMRTLSNASEVRVTVEQFE